MESDLPRGATRLLSGPELLYRVNANFYSFQDVFRDQSEDKQCVAEGHLRNMRFPKTEIKV